MHRVCRARGSQPGLATAKISKGMCAWLFPDPVNHVVEWIPGPFEGLLAVTLVILQGGREREGERDGGKEG